MFETSSWVYTDSYCRPSMSALSLAPEKSLPFSLRAVPVPVLGGMVAHAKTTGFLIIKTNAMIFFSRWSNGQAQSA